MSAFDIAGAVFASPVAAALWLATFGATIPGDPGANKRAAIAASAATIWAAFCIARLCGASL